MGGNSVKGQKKQGFSFRWNRLYAERNENLLIKNRLRFRLPKSASVNNGLIDAYSKLFVGSIFIIFGKLSHEYPNQLFFRIDEK